MFERRNTVIAKRHGGGRGWRKEEQDEAEDGFEDRKGI